MKRSQIQSQVFVFIIALISLTFFLLYAFKFLIVFHKNVYTSEMITFINDFKDNAEQMAMQYGSQKAFAFKNVPSTYDEVCFLQYSAIDPNTLNNYSVIKLTYDASITISRAEFGEIVKPNVFIRKNKISLFAFHVPNMVVDHGFFCVPIKGGQFKIVMEGQGDSVLIKAPKVGQ